jgi:hypothetical protein
MWNDRSGWIVALAILGSCSSDVKTTSTATTAVTIQNGLETNGLWENGLWENGLWENGLWENGLWENGLWENGLWENGLWENGLWENGLWENGLWENGLWENGYRQTELRNNPYAGKLLQYIYECAMPNDPALTTTLDPSGAAVTLTGAIGLGINADDTGWWESGKCDETCQRWVSACVLARTNAYGVHVGVSLRAPLGAPARILQALGQDPVTGAVLDSSEQSDFTLREGAYYGNIFATTPTTPVPAGYTGPATGPIQNTPQYFACAGPASNIPEITKRFCSSSGDNEIIKVTGSCLTTSSSSPGACDGEDLTSGAMHGCSTRTSTPTKYDQVLTVYLSQPIAVCGNGVCEQGEDSTSCASDCHPGTWAKTMDTLDAFRFLDQDLISPVQTKVAVDPSDNSIVVADIISTQTDLDLDGDGDPTNHVLASPGLGNQLVLLKFDVDGNYVWGSRTAAPFAGDGPHLAALAIGPDGSIVAAGWKSLGPTNWLAKFTGDGSQVTQGWPMEVGSAHQPSDLAIALDRSGNVILGSTINSPNFVPVVFGTHSLVPLEPGQTGFTAKLWSDGTLHAGGLAAWAVFTGSPTSVAVDPDGNALVGSMGNVDKLAAADGARIWGLDLVLYNGGEFSVFPTVASDGSGNVYVAEGARDNRLVQKFSRDAAFLWDARYTQRCPDGGTSCSAGQLGVAGGRYLAVDPTGSTVIVGGTLLGTATIHGVVDLGAGAFDTYNSIDVFVAAFATADTLGTGEHRFRWAKHIPMILDSKFTGYAVDGRGHVVIAGEYGGSMLLDNQLLVNSIPEGGHSNMFLGSFAGATAGDITPPTIANLPTSFDVQATSSAGVIAWYMPPTAKDDQGAGATVACTPASSSQFPIGNTTVTCTATDASGNAAVESFVVHVIDKMGPSWSTTSDVGVEATGPGGAVAMFPTPIATDQLDGDRSVTCTPPSGSQFPVGSTTVTCSATDASSNTSHTNLQVVVHDTTPPVLTLPADITVDATTAGGSVVSYTATANDIVDGAVTPVCTPVSGSLFPLGQTTVQCMATDAHGNSNTGTFHVNVRVAWSGILQPINADNSSVFHLGSTVSTKFALTGGSAGITNLVATLSIAKISNGIEGTFVETSSTSAADSGNQFRYDSAGHQYIFNLATSGLTKGTWRLRIDLGDGVTHTVDISLK